MVTEWLLVPLFLCERWLFSHNPADCGFSQKVENSAKSELHSKINTLPAQVVPKMKTEGIYENNRVNWNENRNFIPLL